MITGTGYYKFLNRSDVARVLAEGTVLVSSLEYFRNLESERWKLIADRLEGASELTMPKQFVATENSPELEMINNSGVAEGVALKAVHVIGNGRVDLSGAKFRRTIPGHIYCASNGYFEELSRYYTMEAELKYDACLRVTSFRRLMRRIFRTGHIVGTQFRFSDLFYPGIFGRVSYEPRSRSIEDGPVLDVSPFKKGLAFKPQCEVRALFVPKDGVSVEDRLIVKIDDPASVFSEIAL